MVLIVVLFTACAEDQEPIDKITLNENELSMYSGDFFQLKVAGDLPYTTVWYSSDKNIAAISDNGLVTAIAKGEAYVTADIGYAKSRCKVVVLGDSKALSLSPLGAPLADNLIYSKNIVLKAPYRVMQGFDIDSKNNLYYIQLGAVNANVQGQTKSHELYVIKSTSNNTDISDFMTFQYFGHGSNMVIEENTNGETYVWLNSLATKNTTTNEYGNSPSFSRIKYEKGKIYKEGYGGENFFLNNGKLNTHPAIDFKNRMLCVTATQNSTRYFYTYDLDQALALPDTQFAVDVTFGGEETDIELQTVKRQVVGKDLSKLTPLGSFSLIPGSNKATDINSYSMQGHDICDGFIYYNEGDGNGNDILNGCSNDYVTVLDLNGNIVRARTAVNAITGIDALKNMGITDSGYMEGEGIKVKGDKIYIGFASRRNPAVPGNDDYRRANIFVYDCSGN